RRCRSTRSAPRRERARRCGRTARARCACGWLGHLALARGGQVRLLLVVSRDAGDRVLELAHALADRAAGLGEALGPEDQEGDHEDQDDLHRSDLGEHGAVRLLARRWGQAMVAVAPYARKARVRITALTTRRSSRDSRPRRPGACKCLMKG